MSACLIEILNEKYVVGSGIWSLDLQIQGLLFISRNFPNWIPKEEAAGVKPTGDAKPLLQLAILRMPELRAGRRRQGGPASEPEPSNSDQDHRDHGSNPGSQTQDDWWRQGCNF